MSRSEEVKRAADSVAAKDPGRVSLADFKPKLFSDLTRLGINSDGGYVVNERAVLKSRYLLSFGVNEDWSFELAFLNRNKDVKVFCFDFSVSKSVFRKRMFSALNDVFSLKFLFFVCTLNFSEIRQKLFAVKHNTRLVAGFSRFLANENVRFFPLGISNVEAAPFVTISQAIRLMSSEPIPENSIFVKMDIEQYEFRVLADLLEYSRFINSLVVEFHDLDILWPPFVELMNKLDSQFEITHVHGNNNGGLIPNTEIPTVLEITFVKRGIIPEECRLSHPVSYPLPHLDFPNNLGKKDYGLNF